MAENDNTNKLFFACLQNANLSLLAWRHSDLVYYSF